MPSFVVEDGTGRTDATSLCSVADADAHWSIHPDGGRLWDPLHEDEKESRLMHASLLASRRLRWRGVPLSRTQAFPLPARELYDYQGFLLSSAAVPADAARGVAELAGLLAQAGVLSGDSPPVKSTTTGPVSVTYAVPAGAGSIGGIPAQVIDWLKPYVFTEPMLVRC